MDNSETVPPDTQPQIDPTEPVTLNEGSYDLDLDLIQPQSKTVRLGGKLYEVQPPMLKDIVNLTRYVGKLSSGNSDDVMTASNGMLATFQKLMPGLKDDSVDLSLPQLMALFEFVSEMASPNDNSALKAMGVAPTQEKKAP